MSRRAIPNPGEYPAKTNGKMVVYETDEGALCVAIPVALTNSEVAWSGKHTATIGTREGELKTKTIANLKKIFPEWDGVNPFLLEDMDTSAIDFSIVGEHSEYTPAGESEPVTTFKIIFLNPPGGSANMPEPVAERKAVLTKWSGKFKANAPAQPAKKAAPTTTASAAGKPTASSGATSKPASSGPPSRRSNATSAMARTSSAEEVWKAFSESKANEGKNDDELGPVFYGAQDEVAPGANGELTPAQWGEVANKLGV